MKSDSLESLKTILESLDGVALKKVRHDLPALIRRAKFKLIVKGKEVRYKYRSR